MACRSEVSRASSYKALYDLTLEEYDRILAHQGGVCAICQRPPKVKRLGVDHNHKTGQVRGLVCWACNSFLGKIRDDAQVARRAAEYLEAHPATAALGREVFGRTGSVKRRRKPRRK